MRQIHGEASFHLATAEVEISLTERAGHLAPVVFHLPGGDVSPYALAPWEPAEFPEQPPLLSILRGDFLCFPFGGNENGPPHGETANFPWSLKSMDEHSICLEINTADTGAHVEKTISTRPGQFAIYQEHQISGLEGDFNYGSHPLLDFSKVPESSGRITTSAFHFGSVFPGSFSVPENGESQSLEGGSRFTDLACVQLATGGTTDLTRYPARPGNDDLIMVTHYPATEAQPFAWSAAVFENYVWFSLKNPADFPSTLLWTSNGGRTAPPWNGRHVGRLGIEDVCSHFCDGVDISRKDLLADEGIPTTRRFRKEETVSLKLIHGVAPITADFGAILEITPSTQGVITITGETASIEVAVDWKFIV